MLSYRLWRDWILYHADEQTVAARLDEFKRDFPHRYLRYLKMLEASFGQA